MTDTIDPLPEHVRAVVEDPARLEALAALEMVKAEPDADFQRLSRAVAHIFKAEYALVTLVGKDRQWLRASFGSPEVTGQVTDLSFSAYTLTQPGEDAMVVLDVGQDGRFTNRSPIAGWKPIQFYAGAPIIIGGKKLGTLCVLGASPRDAIDPDQLDQLVDLAGVAATLFVLKDEARVRARTAAALLREEWRHALTLEAGKVGSWVWDIRSGEVACNETFRCMYELADTGPVFVDDVLEATHPADRDRARAGLQASLDDGIDYSAEARVAGSGRWLTMRGRVYQRDAEGKPLIMMGASIDVTESKQSAEQTRLLLRELNHRVKNTLAMIQSVARQTIRQNPDPKAFLDAFSGRLRTISDAHVLLADRDWSGVQLYEVVAAQLGPDFLSAPDQTEVHGADVTLPADHALGLGLILHELTTNAHRYGAWSSEQGLVSINWELKEHPKRGLALSWRERGGPEVGSPHDAGLGTRLIERSLAKVLDSEVKLEFRPEGVAVDIWLPLPSEDG